jgi:hypothetical protein
MFESTDDEKLRSLLANVNKQLEELAVFLQEVANRPKTANQSQLYNSVVEERARLISFADAICKDLIRIGYAESKGEPQQAAAGDARSART